jgi:hypothetical protein
MHEIFSWFSTSPGFMPHGMCYLWQPEGWGQESDKEKAYAAGFDQHLRKPVDPATVLEALAKL